MRSKYIPIEMRGQQVSSDTSDIEEKLIKCLRGLLGGEKRVIRTIIFRHVREINPAFLGEFHSASHFIKLRKWFYSTLLEGITYLFASFPVFGRIFH